MNIISHEDLDIPEILHYFTNGVVVIPTETVYGLAAVINNDDILSNIYTLKKRPADNPLIVHVSSLEMLKTVIDGDIPECYKDLINRYWPGPISLLFRANKTLSKIVTAGLDTVLVRIPANNTILRIIDSLGVPLAAPSANTSGRPSPSCVHHAVSDFGDDVKLYIDGGECRVGLESTVFSYLNNDPVILRPGGICKEDIESVIKVTCKDVQTKKQNLSKFVSPGQRYKHYSPKTRFVLITSGLCIKQHLQEYKKNDPLLKIGVLWHFNMDCTIGELSEFVVFSLGSSPNEIANKLYKGLRYLDGTCDVIYTCAVKHEGQGEAIMDRLQKSAHETM